MAAQQPPENAVILDLGLPDIDGTEVIVEWALAVQADSSSCPGRTSPEDKIGALQRGGRL